MIPLQHSPPAKNTRSKRNKTVLSPTARAPLYHTPSVHELSANLDRGPPIEKKYPPDERRLREAENKVLEDSNETEVEGAPETSESPNPSLSNKPLGSQAEPKFLKMREKVAQLMGQLT
ncbi:hypothetical protein O181_078066 [Austropuccinia psidii MF-1]|uniref:Uncharacterized protein n=1 Tax=Austropuccinia psidii MF-1 TaxID=1389203 RepID=A0A9Q3FDK7_9BASI|nr:hypothetical protein [Austropuccinia psidii MF-1]